MKKMWRHFLFIGRDRCHLFYEKSERKKGSGLYLIKDEKNFFPHQQGLIWNYEIKINNVINIEII